ncbi:P63C domain-containing protein [Janthinobacterium sp. 67]|uniref:P63C domain-containing protein n=1 Tax=Janthinobacterium sp. 67 TaxID=2035207 RepID=UPI000C2326A9|nr:P63C domain-containing protein [Janthinobacterium sp. 67]PJJ20045.1 P63C domain-containing protein [Janthinobacterium sp. 67]
MEESPKGRSKGGVARAESLSVEKRKEISANAIATRWENAARRSALPSVVLKQNDLCLAGLNIPCAIIEGEGKGEVRRVLTESGITEALLGTRSGASKRLKKASQDAGAPVPIFLAPRQLTPFIEVEISSGLLAPIEYVDGNRIVIGYDARILPTVCDIWLKAREAGALQAQQLDKAQKAEVLMRALAHIGIIALVDEATGYQNVRAKDALSKILEAFVAKELQPWIKKFPPSFYEEIFRLRKLEFPSSSVRRPQYFGHLTNDIIYRRLAPGVWKELKAKVAKNENGRPKHKLHQNLTQEIGDPRLRDLITSVTTIMKLSNNWGDFKQKIDRIHPPYNETMLLPFEITEDSGEGF